MKKIKIPFLLLFSCLILASCHFSKGTNTDFTTGLSYNYNGFGVGDVVLVGPDNQKMNSNKVNLDTKIAIVATGIEHYGLKDGKAFPGMSLSVSDKNGNTMLKSNDLFEGDEGHAPEQASELRGSVTVGNPMKAGQTYHVKLHIWDKVTPENEINVETNLVVQ
jgi:hypothetical protein